MGRRSLGGAWIALAALALGAPAAEGPRFQEVGPASGVAFRFHAGSRGKHDLPEIMGGGVALLDADGDGRLDLYLCNGGPILPADGQPDPPGRLYLNRGDMRFEDATEASGAPGPSYAMGAAVGDVDGDGRPDLFVTGWRDQRLYRNLGAGRFADVTRESGLASDLWSTSAAFADLDGDGDLDLYVCNYVAFDPQTSPYCSAPDGRADFCGPEEFDAQPDRLYRNDGRGRFVDVSGPSGLVERGGRALGVIAADLVGDSRPDLFVANDGEACRLYENRGGMRFRECAGPSGVAYDATGRALAGMGVACGDLDGDGLPDLLSSNFLGRSTIAFRGLGDGLFRDESDALGLRATTRPVLGFGLALEDFDGDGSPDLLQANGHVLDRARLGEPFAMRPTLLRNERGRFHNAAPSAGPFFATPILGRGVATGDLDGDGRPDAVVAALDRPPAILKNVSPGARFLTVELGPSASAIGAVIRAEVGGRTLVRPVLGGGSYLSASDRRVTIGLGGGAVEGLEVRWPSGRVERFRPPSGPGSIRLVEGSGVR